MRKNENMPQDEYARIERESRFLLAQFPSIANRCAAHCKPNNDGQNLHFVP
jgi:hypothetical protein